MHSPRSTSQLMTRRGHDLRDKGLQQADSSTTTSQRSSHSDEGVHEPTSRRQAALSPPDSAAGEPAHQARMSRFLRRSRSKQQVRDSGNDVHNSEASGLPPRSHALSPGTLEPSSSSVKPSSIAAERSPSPSLQSVASRTSGVASPPPTRGGDTTPASQAFRAGSTDSSRVGGHWISNMLGASQNAQTQRQNDDGASVRSFSTTATSPSRFLRRGQHESPSRKSSIVTFSSTNDAPRPSVDKSKPAATRMGGFDRMFDRAMQYFTDSDSNADKDPSDIWLLGVRHDGWRPDRNLAESETLPTQASRSSFDTITGELDPSASEYPKVTSSRQMSGQRLSKSVPNRPASSDSGSSSGMAGPSSPSPSKAKRLFTRKGQASDLRPAQSNSVPAQTMHSLPLGRATSDSGMSSQSDEISRDPSQGTFSGNAKNGVLRSPSNLNRPVSSTQTYGWPPAFYHDFYSRIQLTYRSGFMALPAPSSSAASSSNTVTSAFTSMISNLGASMGRNAAIGNQSASNAATGLTTDTGWGCMLRTGQSLLANTLMDVHLGRTFRRPLPREGARPLASPDFFSSTPIYPRYVRLTSWFLDDPSPDAPFSIHKFVNEGKRLGKQVGEWFGPSTAAGAIAALANDYAPANIGVAQAIDTTVYGSEVSQVARGNAAYGWNRPVLILVPLRLGLNGVNPIYYSSIQHYFTLPQCVGIAGGRPSSSYYFVGTQGNQLFYIDPHHTKPTVKKVPIPEQLSQASAHEPLSSALDPAGASQQQLDNLDIFFANAYGTRDLESFHCEKVRKMSLAALDPSMLVGLLCKSRADWDDLCRRMKGFPASKEHHPLINIVQEMPAWMRNPSRTISGAGLNTSVSKKAVQAGQSTGDGRQMRARDESMISNAEELEGNSVDYADSDDWDIDDSDDPHSEGNSTRESIIVNQTRNETDTPSNSLGRHEPSHQAVHGSIRLVTKQPTSTPSSSLPDDFERINVDSLSVSPTSPCEGLDNEPVVVVQSSSLPSAHAMPASASTVQQGRQVSLEAEDRAAGWEACTTARQSLYPKR